MIIIHFYAQILVLTSAIGVFFGVIAMGVYMHLKSSEHIGKGTSLDWISLLLFSWIILFNAIGILPLPIPIVSEILPTQLKSFGISFFIAFMWTLVFINAKCFPVLIGAIEFHWTMYIYAITCSIGIGFIAIFLPETKRKSHSEIMKSLDK